MNVIVRPALSVQLGTVIRVVRAVVGGLPLCVCAVVLAGVSVQLRLVSDDVSTVRGGNLIPVTSLVLTTIRVFPLAVLAIIRATVRISTRLTRKRQAILAGRLLAKPLKWLRLTTLRARLTPRYAKCFSYSM